MISANEIKDLSEQLYREAHRVAVKTTFSKEQVIQKKLCSSAHMFSYSFPLNTSALSMCPIVHGSQTGLCAGSLHSFPKLSLFFPFVQICDSIAGCAMKFPSVLHIRKKVELVNLFGDGVF